MFFPPSAVPTANGREAELREPTGQRMTAGNSAGALELDKSSSRHSADWTAPAGEFRAMHDQLTQLDRGRCKAPAPYYFYKDGKLVCRGAGDSHLPRSMRARSPHVLSPRRRFQPLTDEERSSESRRAQCITSGIPPELSNLMNQVLATERFGPLRRGDFVLCTTSLRGWIAADAKHLHQKY